MARVLGVVFLFSLAIIKMVNANPCAGLSEYDDCGDGRVCVCPNKNVVTEENNGNVPCNNLVCRYPECYSSTGRHAKPQMDGGSVVSCGSDDDCRKHYECVGCGFCCPVAKGKFAKLV
ncbi:uncharacterized protein LOC132741760 [Ruditapes philippinarum]|uniref:uncharacterized protein LOC132741760 n=1 Tax=Ruditapes philippinarum TaxID=129788 RepID=UPI00295AD22A|nr:uncharacterized protein LOC132741760 [Ruditapes philippinarum]